MGRGAHQLDEAFRFLVEGKVTAHDAVEILFSALLARVDELLTDLMPGGKIPRIGDD
ncbi:MAG: hypothetical protein KJZ98_10605 [Burkholderiaceae bacterium]|nr:hypothetical protein [Burkholderiaceae bacterium]MEB2350098.1 hypothetical protein [Burkholderiaceae bacterium]